MVIDTSAILAILLKDDLSQRPATDLGDSAASLLEHERQQRERDLT